MTDLRESGALQATKVSGTRYRARLIEGNRWGSSGYYPREVLERDGPNVWPAGTPVYLDHPTDQEEWERPERSVRDLAGKITTTPVYESDGLYADVEFYPHTAPVLEALWADVGMSIRAAGTTESGERDGRTGPIITGLSEGRSVDVVTRAGAGGKLVALIESARGETRHPTTSQPPAGQGNTPTRKDGIMPEIKIEESAHAALVEKASRADTATAQLEEAQAKIAALEAAQAEAERRQHVTALVEAEFAGVDAPVTQRLLIESLTGGDASDEQITTQAKEAAAEHAASTGAGQVRGLGSTTPTSQQATEASDELPTWDELAKIKGA